MLLDKAYDQAVVKRRLFQIHAMAGLWHDFEPRAGQGLLEEIARLDARLVLVAEHDQRRHVESRNALLMRIERRPLRLHTAHRVGDAERRAGAELSDEVPVFRRILFLEAVARRGGRVMLGEHAHTFIEGELGEHLHAGGELAGLHVGAAADAGQRDRAHARWMPERELQGRGRTHRDADDMRILETEPVEHRADIARGDVLRIRGDRRRYVGGRIAALAIGDTAPRVLPRRDLQIEGAAGAGELVDKDDRRRALGAAALGIKLHAVGCAYLSHDCLNKGWCERSRRHRR